MNIKKEVLNICLVADEYPTETGWGGIGTYHYNLARGLRDNGCNVIVIARALEKESIETSEGITVHRILPYYNNSEISAESIGYRISVSNKINELVNNGFNIDLIETPEWKAEIAVFMASNTKIPIVIRMHSTFSLIKEINNITYPNHSQILQEELEYQVIEKADYVYSSSKSLIEIVNSHRKIHRTIEHMVNPANNIDFTPGEPKDYLINEYSDYDNIVLYVGRIEERKGVESLFQSIEPVLKEHPKTLFIFIGRDTKKNSGESMWQYLNNLYSKNISKNIKYIGYVEYLKLVEYYRLADVCIFPSYYENFPAVCLEAMSCGRAVIGSKYGGMSEIIEDSISGFLIDPFDIKDIYNKINNILSSGELKKRLSENAKKRIDSTFDRILVSKKIVDIYKRVIRDKKNV